MKRLIKPLAFMAVGAIIATAAAAIASTDHKSRAHHHRGYFTHAYGPGPPGFEARHGFRARIRFAGRAAILKDAAGKLGVSPADLRSAVKSAHEQVGPPKPPANPSPGAFKQSIEDHCNAVTDAVASKLNTDAGQVRDAFRGAIKDQIEKAVSGGKLSRARADRIESRIDSAPCPLMPPFRGCAAGPGPGAPGPDGPPPPM